MRDQGGTLSSAVSAAVTLDRTAPVLAEAPVLWYSTTSGSWRARWKAAKDLHGPVAYRVQYSVNNGPWKIATLQTPKAGIVLPVRSRAAKVAVRVRAGRRARQLGACEGHSPLTEGSFPGAGKAPGAGRGRGGAARHGH